MMKACETRGEDPDMKALKVNRDRLLDLVWYVNSS